MQTRHPAVSFYRVDWQGELVGYVMLIHAQQPTQWIIERLTIDEDISGRAWDTPSPIN